jgi:hypothetical protein
LIVLIANAHGHLPSPALTHERVFDPMLREGAGRPATRSALAAFGRK